MNETLGQLIKRLLLAGKTPDEVVAELRSTPPWSMIRIREDVLRQAVTEVELELGGIDHQRVYKISHSAILASKRALERIAAHRKECSICDVAFEAKSATLPPCPVGLVRHRQHVKALQIVQLEFQRAGLDFESVFAQFVKRKQAK